MLGSSVEGIDDARHVLANTKRKWLLILDNADDPDFDYHEYFPSGTWGTIIITSRVSDCSQYNTVGSETLTSLNEQESVNLLLKVAEIPLELWPSHKLAAEGIVRDLSSHTLALIQAGAYIAQDHCSMKDYPRELQRQRARLLTFKPKQAQSRYSNVFATFEASASVLRSSKSREASDALCLLEVLSMLHFDGLPMRIFEDAWNGSQRVRKASHDEKLAIDTLSTWHRSQLPGFIPTKSDEWDSFRLQEASHLLTSLFLITKSTRHGFVEVSMHSLVHAWAKDRLSSNEQDQAWNTTGSILALSFYGSQIWQTHGRQLRPHVHSYLNIRTTSMSSLNLASTTAPVLFRCGCFLTQMRDDTILATLLERMFDDLGIDSRYPSKLMELLPLYDLQARNLRNLGAVQASVALLQKVVKIRETTLAQDHPDQLTSQHALACAYRANGQITEAVQLLEQVVKIQETTLAQDHPDRLALQHALVSAHRATGATSQNTCEPSWSK